MEEATPNRTISNSYAKGHLFMVLDFVLREMPKDSKSMHKNHSLRQQDVSISP